MNSEGKPPLYNPQPQRTRCLLGGQLKRKVWVRPDYRDSKAVVSPGVRGAFKLKVLSAPSSASNSGNANG